MSLRPTIVSVHCRCGAHLRIRTKDEFHERICWSCNRTVKVHLYPNGAVRAYVYTELERPLWEQHQLAAGDVFIEWQGPPTKEK